MVVILGAHHAETPTHVILDEVGDEICHFWRSCVLSCPVAQLGIKGKLGMASGVNLWINGL